MQLPNNLQDIIAEIKFYIRHGFQDWTPHLRKEILNHFKYYEDDILNPNYVLTIILFARIYDYPKRFEYLPDSNMMVLRTPPPLLGCCKDDHEDSKDDGGQDTT